MNTDFLDLRQIVILEAILRQEKITDYQIHQPFVNGFRATVSFNEHADNTIMLHANQPKQDLLQHHQILGFILNQMKLEMRVLGDLYLTAKDIYLSVCIL
ncbi:hypothetical protein [Spiroplasma endosymbiont of Polydrusus cervinus]|uniref:hypothetical protein n=1 Tax=Spiroplasma endosymbiont of Polydrusus cervinus TaxID=3066287 RepID=UPI0030CB996A